MSAFFIFVIAYVVFLSEAHSTPASKPLVRVRLLEVSKSLKISGSSLKFQNLGSRYQTVAIPAAAKAEVRVLEKDGKRLWALRVNDQDPEQLFHQNYLLVQGENLRLGAKPVPSQVVLNLNANKNVDVIGLVPLEDYVIGVIASEMPLSWPLETLKAQAVAARSYALAVMNERKDKPYQLESTVLDQVYQHVLTHNENDPLVKKAVQAVRSTEGIELYTADNKILKSFFHADCGGETTSAKNVWNAGPSAGVVVDKSCPFSPKAHWKLEVSKLELEKKLNISGLSKLELIRTPGEKRIKSVKVTFADSKTILLSSNELRQKLGFQELKSSLFDLKTVGSNYVFEGRGFGHGVGMCQWGSRALGKNGLSFRQILKHYYPLALLK
ncbi:SpoIID/LytB domain-containing protein [Bdellovibrio reynosensis]|uniref:SpoIID/LytB domain-containing protein n=1 Tax=Bdellovibrio reynosensis TaxID=2835041 RepID=A0ABY4CA76_9BACT|nr:SpoIID/LytB domain-containing protein [Bdellovibrio reynosensis]UOF01758.1 SpoIID/LytB domain-containing protein [Bdellovibrio reynosensis]